MSAADSELFNVDINNYNGPLDVLLDLAKAQKVDLEEISITKLADQFHDYITNEKNLNLLIEPFFSEIDFEKLRFSSNNRFSFKTNRKFEFSNFILESDILVNEFSFIIFV